MKKTLSNVSSKLIKLHRDLLFFQASLAEKEDERQYSPYDLLTLSIHDARFAWLRQFSELITQIDMITDDKEGKPFDLQAIINETKKLIEGEAADVSPNYKLALQANTETIVKQLDVKKALALLEPFTQTLHEAHTENEKKKYQH